MMLMLLLTSVSGMAHRLPPVCLSYAGSAAHAASCLDCGGSDIGSAIDAVWAGTAPDGSIVSVFCAVHPI